MFVTLNKATGDFMPTTILTLCDFHYSIVGAMAMTLLRWKVNLAASLIRFASAR